MEKTNNSGVTLVALVITIIVLLILAGISLTFAFGDNGIISKAQKAKIETEQAQAKEEINLKISDLKLEKQGQDLTLEELVNSNSDISFLNPTSSTESSTRDIIYNNQILTMDSKLNIVEIREYFEGAIEKITPVVKAEN